MLVASKQEKGRVLHILDFPEPHVLQDLRISGSIERGLDLYGCRKIRVDMTQSMGKAIQ